MATGRQYGPHRPEDAPNSVTVLGSGKWPNPEVRPIHPALVRQREQVNTAAHEAGFIACPCGWWHHPDRECPTDE